MPIEKSTWKKNMENMHTDVRVWRVSFQYSKGKCLLKPTKITDETVVLLCVLAAPWPHILLLSWSHIVIECITGKFLLVTKFNMIKTHLNLVHGQFQRTCQKHATKKVVVLRSYCVAGSLLISSSLVFIPDNAFHFLTFYHYFILA